MNSEPKWEYLKLEVFDVRHASALMFLRDMPMIVELGGWKTPLSRFTAIPVHQYGEFKVIYGIFGFCALGLDLDEGTVLEPISNLFNRSERAILETPADFSVGQKWVEWLLYRTKKKVKWTIDFDLSNNILPALPGYPPFMKRRMIVCE
jgi:hypothetical protein